jgi:hypothetical protein
LHRGLRMSRTTQKGAKLPLVTAAIFGLIGVLVGASRNGLVQWLMARRSDVAEARTAARLVTYELREYQQLLQYTLLNRRWETGLWFSPAIWREHQARLAGACSTTEWIPVERAYLGIEIVDGWHRVPPGSSAHPKSSPTPRRQACQPFCAM